MRVRTSRLRSLFCGTVNDLRLGGRPNARSRAGPMTDGCSPCVRSGQGVCPPSPLTWPRWGRAAGLGVRPRRTHHGESRGPAGSNEPFPWERVGPLCGPCPSPERRPDAVCIRTEGNRSMCTSLAGKRVLVTGGTRGMGAAIAELLTAQSAHVVITARHQDDRSPVRLILADLTSAEGAEFVADQAI